MVVDMHNPRIQKSMMAIAITEGRENRNISIKNRLELYQVFYYHHYGLPYSTDPLYFTKT